MRLSPSTVDCIYSPANNSTVAAQWQQGEYGSRPFLKHKIGILTRARKPTIFTEKPPHTERITLRKAKDEVFRFHKYKKSHFLGFKF